MSQRIAGGGYNGRKGERKNRIKTLMSFLMTLGICLLLLNACSEGSGSSAAPTEPVFLKISTDLTSSKVDVNPAHDVVAENIVLHGMASVREYHVVYVREDGSANVPNPFVVQIDQSSVTSGDGLKIAELILLRKEALQQAPFVPYPGAKAPLRLDTILEFFGENDMGNAVSGTVSLSPTCADF